MEGFPEWRAGDDSSDRFGVPSLDGAGDGDGDLPSVWEEAEERAGEYEPLRARADGPVVCSCSVGLLLASKTLRTGE